MVNRVISCILPSFSCELNIRRTHPLEWLGAQRCKPESSGDLQTPGTGRLDGEERDCLRSQLEEHIMEIDGDTYAALQLFFHSN